MRNDTEFSAKSLIPKVDYLAQIMLRFMGMSSCNCYLRENRN